ncbi:MAG: hypothetical protein JSV96_15660 [Candidatus Aminicenantes bacterium]|nr:MAG: hypothetical protein JSV96_15660 [Candidatus Aminicenantes bacterium]
MRKKLLLLILLLPVLMPAQAEKNRTHGSLYLKTEEIDSIQNNINCSLDITGE